MENNGFMPPILRERATPVPVDPDWWAKHVEREERCTVCDKVILVMCQKGTGICSRNCEKKKNNEAVIPVAESK